ncbi:MAG TPA: hypothetical protein VFE51_09240 [Verrucomicrobiae bacterium]|nr:hypothetical protein [Verrucomicrobiae bacterium]
MNPFGMFQLVFVALEGVACALNPKLRREKKKKAVGFGLFYIGFLLAGIALVVVVVRSLYFRQ